MSEDRFYGESFRSRLSEKIALSNWLPLMFYLGLAVVVTVLLLIIGGLAGPPLLYAAIGFIIVIDAFCIILAKKYGWPVELITDACIRVGGKIIVLEFPQGRIEWTVGDVFYNKSVGVNGWMDPAHAPEIAGKISREELGKTGGFMQLHIKSDYGIDSSGIYLVQMPKHIRDLNKPVIYFKGVELPQEDWVKIGKRKFRTFTGCVESRLFSEGEDYYLNNMHKIAPVITDIVGRFRYKQMLEEKDLQLKSRDKRIESLLAIIQQNKLLDKAVREAGQAAKWYENTGARVFVELAVILGLALLFIFVAGVVF